jgi:hypothetical protein
MAPTSSPMKSRLPSGDQARQVGLLSTPDPPMNCVSVKFAG